MIASFLFLSGLPSNVTFYFDLAQSRIRELFVFTSRRVSIGVTKHDIENVTAKLGNMIG